MIVLARKRFYRDVSLASTNGGDRFEVLLDGRRVKTPLGNTLVVEGEAMARAVQQEWRAQTDLVVTQQMHLTGLCNACVDNPTGAGKEALADAILAYLDTDTVLYFSLVSFPNGLFALETLMKLFLQDNEDLLRHQNESWLPLVSWFCQRHSITVDPATSLLPPKFSPGARDVIRSGYYERII